MNEPGVVALRPCRGCDRKLLYAWRWDFSVWIKLPLCSNIVCLNKTNSLAQCRRCVRVDSLVLVWRRESLPSRNSSTSTCYWVQRAIVLVRCDRHIAFARIPTDYFRQMCVSLASLPTDYYRHMCVSLASLPTDYYRQMCVSLASLPTDYFRQMCVSLASLTPDYFRQKCVSLASLTPDYYRQMCVSLASLTLDYIQTDVCITCLVNTASGV